jgi:hypothetical protein
MFYPYALPIFLNFFLASINNRLKVRGDILNFLRVLLLGRVNALAAFHASNNFLRFLIHDVLLSADGMG